MITTLRHLDYGLTNSELDCVCCGTALPDRDGFCRDCQTPIGLSRAVATRESSQSFVSVLGASGAGKTVFLGLLLDLLSNGSERLKGLAASAFSVALQEQVITALEQRTFPEKTQSEADTWDWLHCQVTTGLKKKMRQVDLIAPDFAGEAIGLEIEQTGLYPAIRHVVSKSAGLLILCDSLKVRDAGSAEDLFALKLASYIAQSQGIDVAAAHKAKELNVKPKHKGPAIAIVFTKCDGCPETREDPEAFATNNTPRLAEFCRQTFHNYAFFSAGVVGSAGVLADRAGRHMQIPFHIEPHGIIEPLEWVMQVCQ